MELKLEPRHIFASILIIIGVIPILHSIFQAVIGIGAIMDLIGTEITELQAFIETLGWFFALLIEALGGFFLSFLGVKIAKK
jgi:hypothetical protein